MSSRKPSVTVSDERIRNTSVSHKQNALLVFPAPRRKTHEKFYFSFMYLLYILNALGRACMTKSMKIKYYNKKNKKAFQNKGRKCRKII
jgi:hypothetical protein